MKRQTCAFDGDGFLGSRGGAKASVDFIDLAPVHNRGATVRDMCQVAKIVRDSPADAAEYAVHFSSLIDAKKEVVRTKASRPCRRYDEHAAAPVCEQSGTSANSFGGLTPPPKATTYTAVPTGLDPVIFSLAFLGSGTDLLQ